jgi:putative transposase
MTLDVDRFRFPIRDNATAERFVRTARTELPDHTLIWNERQLRRLLVEYLEHYNTHRPRRGINQHFPTSIDQTAPEPVPIDRICRRRVLDGLINEYHHAA